MNEHVGAGRQLADDLLALRFADVDAERTCRYDLPEYLSPTDSTVVVIRKVLAEFARGVHNREELDELDAIDTREEDIVTRRNLEALEAAKSVHAQSIREGLAKIDPLNAALL